VFRAFLVKSGQTRQAAGCSHEQSLFGGYGFDRANPDTGAAILAFIRIYPAMTILFGNSLGRTFAVTRTAINARVTDFVRHFIPLSLGMATRYHTAQKKARKISV
jgi:hypothetical protein